MARAAGVVASEPLPVVAGLLKASRMLLCNDGGLMHLANMMGIKTVSLFGPVDEKVYGPYRQNVASEVLTASVPCRPCYQKFVFPECRHQRQCLTQIDAGRVFESVKKVL
jgi:ADP-heptose:LPS heptosyltransferase